MGGKKEKGNKRRNNIRGRKDEYKERDKGISNFTTKGNRKGEERDY